jgi:8-oxo-dGTP diphosphatase
MLADQINFCPRCGSSLTQKTSFGHLRPSCPQCNWIYFADPKVAAVILIEQDGKVLLVRRVNEPRRGCWTFPGGFVDAGEDPARAAERECLEETGLKVRVTGLIDVISGQEHKRGAHIIIVYRGQMIQGEPIAQDDVDQVAFFPRDQLPPLAFTTTEHILKSK